MKRFLILSLLLFNLLTVNAAIKTWTGGATGNWNTATNWNPSGVPIAGDDVIFNSSATVIIDLSISPISLNSLHFINNSTVIFQCGETSNFRLSSTLLANPAFLIEAGSSFTFDAINAGINNSTLDLTVATGCIGTISGTLNISCTGGAANGPKLDTYNSATEYGIITVTNGGVIRILADADNTESSITPVSTIVMQNGSVYENLKNGGSFPAGTWFVNSLARAINTGANPPSFNGISYGNLEWNMPGQTVASFLNDNVTFNNVNLISTNKNAGNGEFRIKTGASLGINTMTVNGNLDIGVDARLVTSSSSVPIGVNGGYIEIKGNITNAGTITSNGVTGTFNDFLITGTTLQNFSNAGSFSGSNLLFSMLNPAGLTLLTPLTLPWNADFGNGKIFTSTTNILTMVDNAIYTGGSSTSFVEGPMKKIGDDDFDFPIGVGSIYAPIGITGGTGSSVTDEFIAEYIRDNPRTVHNGNSKDPFFDHISYVEYWRLNSSSTVVTKNVKMFVHPYSFALVFNTTYPTVWNGSIWAYLDRIPATAGTPSPPYQTGTVTTILLSSFGDFTLATPDIFAINPLPIKLITFNAIKSSPTVALLKWELAVCCSDAAKFEVEKSTDNRTFVSFNNVPGSLINRFYTLQDNRLSKGITYYRLKMIDEDGTITYSKTVALINDETGLLITSLWPNPVQSNATVSVSVAKAGNVNFSICDLSGKIVKQWYASITEGTNNIPVDTEGLASGVYHIIVSGNNSKIVFRFVKQ